VSYVDFDKAEWNRIKDQNNGFETTDDKEKVEVDLTMVGIFGLKDPLRPGIREAVETCHKAGINVRMVTGDNIDTARAISLEAGIID
jgi:magnesium-transporting ATPase (P-type)